MNFARAHLVGISPHLDAYSAKSGRWQFLIINDAGRYTLSHRLRDAEAAKVKGGVSASSTIQGPFDDFGDAVAAAETKLAELRGMA